MPGYFSSLKNSLLRRRSVVFNQGAMSQTHPLTTTAFELPGYRITNSFGVVRGIIVRSRSVIGNIGANIQSLFGGNITLYTNLCERAREDTFNLMLEHAGQLAAGDDRIGAGSDNQEQQGKQPRAGTHRTFLAESRPGCHERAHQKGARGALTPERGGRAPR